MSSLALLLATSATWATEPLFEVVPPEKVPFNYPNPPREGAPNFFLIAQDAQARCVIVQPAGASREAQSAVTALKSYLNLATGARIAVISDDTAIPADMAAIHVGDTGVARKTDLGLPELRYGDDHFPNARGYLVKTLDRRTLVIRGVDDKATNHGIVGFLKRYAGVRQYWPGNPGGLGDVIPSRPTLSIPEVEWRDWPYFFSAHMTHRPFSSTRPALDFIRLNQTLRCSENYNDWLPPGKHAQAHPEFFPLIGGERRIPKDSDGPRGWQPCISNPEVPRLMGEAVADFFRTNPQSPGINFAINDGGGDCTCAACRALDAPGADYARRTGTSERYVKLSNRVCDIVGREFPSKWIVYLAYAAAEPAPSTVKPRPMLLPVLTSAGNMFEQWDEWMKTGARHLGLYVHHDDTFYILPKLDVHQSARRIRYVVASGRARLFYMETQTQWPFADTIPYTTAELLWDPRKDVDALLNEYYTAFYGRAAEAMRSYHQALESGFERWLAGEGKPHWFGKDISANRHPRVPEQVVDPLALTLGPLCDRISAPSWSIAGELGGRFFATERTHGNGSRFLFVINSHDDPSQAELRLAQPALIERWNTITGEAEPWTLQTSPTTATLDFIGRESVLLRIRPSEKWNAAPRRTREVVLPDRWRFRLVRGTTSFPIPKWETTQAIIHPETTMGFRYRAQFRVKQKPERLALLVDNADTRFHSNRVKCDYNCTINAEFAPKLGFNTTFDRRMREFDLTGIVQVGENDLVLEYQHCAWLGGPILPLLTLCGTFAVEDGAITRGGERDTAAVSWTELGYPHFSGAAVYAQTFDWQPVPAGARVLLRCAEIRDHARIRLNGQPAADLPWAPWEVDITAHLRPGLNDLEIEVINTNTNFVEGQAAPSGLLGAVTLIVETV